MKIHTIAVIAWDKRPRDIEKVGKTLWVAILFFFAVIGGAWFLAPDSAEWETLLSSLKVEKENKQAEFSRIEQAISTSTGIKVPMLLCTEALFVAKALKANIEQIEATNGHIDVSIPIKDSESESVSAVMIAEKLRLAMRSFRNSCAVRAIWPDIKLRVYVEPTK